MHSVLDDCDEEERWITIGLVKGVLILTVIHTWKEKKVKKSSESFRREKRRAPRSTSMNINTRRIDGEIKALVQKRDEDIDTSDIPEVKDWSQAVVGKFYRPIKEPVTIRLDADIVAWLKAEGPGYQTRINALLREAMRPSVASAYRRSPRKKTGR